MHKWLLLFCCCWCVRISAQELYVFSEPASNMPARSLSVKQYARVTAAGDSRHTTEMMFGLNKDVMLHAAGSFSNMYSPALRWEGMRLYGKYRFLSSDGMYTHFRMAAFAEVSYSRNRPLFDELSLDGDQSGVEAGLIATQLLHKLALSVTAGYTEGLQQGRFDKGGYPQVQPYEGLSYSLSAGYLVLPGKYTSYDQTNLNIYAELLGQRTTDLSRYFIDIAPAVQLIFRSAVKLNFGYRFELGSNMYRMTSRSWLMGLEWQFLNALKHHSSK